jgi:hypothetical protein
MVFDLMVYLMSVVVEDLSHNGPPSCKEVVAWTMEAMERGWGGGECTDRAGMALHPSRALGKELATAVVPHYSSALHFWAC